MKRIEIENLKALVMGHEMSLYQRSLAVSELHKVVDLINELERTDWCPLPDVEGDYTCPTCNKTYNSLQMAVSCCYEGHGLTPIS